ncbi:uncharacterized protein LOC126664549 isoform X2 [Mercurialis annua]|uniref:uncharacterized protein LOC126664549 isoform X2 n=1 Tax=Mercurialis annua TaxID=3986 RepID=UPI00216025B1|nr:uncharacterized protein LOC126664549 isoform X2 [Mercurialis annua]
MSDEGERTCPLCAEEMDLTDQQLKPCKCGYEICVWCWHQVLEMAAKEETDGRCPACRNPYDKEKIVGMAANAERMAEFHTERKKSQKAKTKSSEGRKQLSSVRVIQRNLVYIVGLPLNLADEDSFVNVEQLLQHREYFGQYGKVLKVSMSRTTQGVIQQFPNNTCSVYITYSKEEEAIRCIQSVHGFILDGRSLKACFGTTKYCHAWLRNVPCTNPDCLYLHEIGSHEDSFTKDEIVSAFTRSRVQQITGTNTSNNMLRRSGSMLPPPLDDFSCNTSASAPKPIVKNTSNNPVTTSKSSPPNGSSGRSIALPAAASWGARATSQPQAANSTSLNGTTKPISDILNGSLAFSSVVTNATQASILHSDVGKRTTWHDDGQSINGKLKLDPSKPEKPNAGIDIQANVLEKPVANLDTADLTLSNQSSSLPTFKHDDSGSGFVSNGSGCSVHNSSSTANGGVASPDNASIKIDYNVRSETSGLCRTSSSLTDNIAVKLPESRGLQQSCADQYSEPSLSPATEKHSAPSDLSDWNTDSQIQTASNTVSEVEEDIISFDNQRLKDPEVVSRTAYMPYSANSFRVSNCSRPHTLQHNEPFGAVNLNADRPYVDNRVSDQALRASNSAVIANGYHDKLISISAGLDRNTEQYRLPNEVENKHMGMLQGDATALDAGEDSIISNILSLDLDSWDDPLTSPQHLAKLLGETDKQPSSHKMSSSWKVQNNHQSRFSFARQEESRNHGVDADTSFSVFGQMQKNLSFGQDIAENRLSYMDKFDTGNGFSSSNFGESELFGNAPSVFSSNKPSVSVPRSQISAPPGFSVPSRAPPPGFSSHERMDQYFDGISGSHLLDSSSLLRSTYQAPPTGNISPNGDIEFMDPAILAVGKGRLQAGLNNQGLDIRSSFPQQLSAFENDPRLQLLMQRSFSPHQNFRYNDLGDNLSSLTDSYGISSRFVDQSQMNSLSPFMQVPLQHSRNGIMSNAHLSNEHISSGHMSGGHMSSGHLSNGHLSSGHMSNGHLSSGHMSNGHLSSGHMSGGHMSSGHMSNGHWDGWNEVQGVNNLGVAELLRNERLGLNKFFGAGYEDSKYRMPNSGDLYNRTFDM